MIDERTQELIEESVEATEPDWMEPEEDQILKKSKEDFELEVWLSTDGKHTVRVLAKTKAQRAEALPYAKALYNKIVATYGTKAEQYTKTNGIQTDKKVAPVCSVHGTTKIWKEGANKETGKPYAFWSCPTKNADGSFCKAK